MEFCFQSRLEKFLLKEGFCNVVLFNRCFVTIPVLSILALTYLTEVAQELSFEHLLEIARTHR
jgi:hypothetical protein